MKCTFSTSPRTPPFRLFANAWAGPTCSNGVPGFEGTNDRGISAWWVRALLSWYPIQWVDEFCKYGGRQTNMEEKPIVYSWRNVRDRGTPLRAVYIQLDRHAFALRRFGTRGSQLPRRVQPVRRWWMCHLRRWGRPRQFLLLRQWRRGIIRPLQRNRVSPLRRRRYVAPPRNYFTTKPVLTAGLLWYM